MEEVSQEFGFDQSKPVKSESVSEDEEEAGVDAGGEGILERLLR